MTTSDGDIALTMLVNFAVVSLMAVGGANTVLPELHRQTVELNGWIGDRQFGELFAIAQAAPGPNVVFVTLLGYHVAGLAGALAATLAMTAPTSALAYAVALVFDRFKDAAWRNVVQAGLVPVTIGLVAASALIVAQAADRDWKTLVITATAFVIVYWTRMSPLIPLAVAAALGISGFL
jgi:chromate transporter